MNRGTIINKCIAGIISHEIGEKEIDLIFKVLDKFAQIELTIANAASNSIEHKAEVIASEEEAKEMLQNGATVRETQEATGLSYRKTAKLSSEIHKQNSIPIRPTKTDNETVITNDNETITPMTSLEIAAEEVKKPDNRSYEEKAEGMKNFCDPTDPDGTKAEALIKKAEEVLGVDEYAIMCNAYNKPETYQRLCNLWDYFHRNTPDNWPERPV